VAVSKAGLEVCVPLEAGWNANGLPVAADIAMLDG
jgi:hypothetical protein